MDTTESPKALLMAERSSRSVSSARQLRLLSPTFQVGRIDRCEDTRETNAFPITWRNAKIRLPLPQHRSRGCGGSKALWSQVHSSQSLGMACMRRFAYLVLLLTPRQPRRVYVHNLYLQECMCLRAPHERACSSPRHRCNT